MATATLEATRARQDADTSVGLPLGAILVLVFVIALNAITLDSGDASPVPAQATTVAMK